MGGWTPGDLRALLGNPFYAINIDPQLAEPHEPLVSEDEWIAANARQVEELGPEAYLRNLLSILKGNYPPLRVGVSAPGSSARYGQRIFFSAFRQRSRPGPPSTRSRPLPPSSRSRPAPPRRTSLPSRPRIQFGPASPTRTSLCCDPSRSSIPRRVSRPQPVATPVARLARTPRGRAT